MKDYIKQLEVENEELRQKLSRCEPYWVKQDNDEHKFFFFFNHCLLAMVYIDNNADGNNHWKGIVYNGTGSIDKQEYTPLVDSFEEAKHHVTEIVFSKRLYGYDL